MTEELTKREDIIITGGLVVPQTFAGLWKLAEIYSKSGLLPKGIDTPERAFLAIQLGQEIGLSPTQALQNIAVINGRATIWGDAMLAVVESSGQMQQFMEGYEGEGDKLAAFTMVQRKGRQPSTTYFSVADAKRAGLWAKQGPWTQYPMRMLKMRARGFALRDNFPDVLKGLYSREEMEDVIDIQPVVIPKTNGKPVEKTSAMPTIDNPADQEKLNLGQPDAEPGEFPPFTPIEVEYINALSEKTKLPVEMIEKRANSNREEFNDRVNSWLKTRKAPADPLARDNWVNLKQAGFSTFVHEHLEAIRAMTDTSEMQVKWSKFYPREPWPLNKNVQEISSSPGKVQLTMDSRPALSPAYQAIAAEIDAIDPASPTVKTDAMRLLAKIKDREHELSKDEAAALRRSVNINE